MLMIIKKIYILFVVLCPDEEGQFRAERVYGLFKLSDPLVQSARAMCHCSVSKGHGRNNPGII